MRTQADDDLTAALFFTGYEYFKHTLPTYSAFSSPDKAPLVHMLAASFGEIVSLRYTPNHAQALQTACLIRVPTEVVKQRQQTAAYGASMSSYGALRQVVAETGLPGLYRGYMSTVAREVCFGLS